MSKYHESEPYSFGGKNRLAEYVGKKKADDIVSRSDIIQALNNIGNQKSIHQHVYTKEESFFNQI